MSTKTPPELTIHRSLTKALKLFDADRFRWLDEAAATGPISALRMGPVKTFVVTDAEAARTMLVTNAGDWTRPPTLLAPVRVGVGENLFTQSDRKWKAFQPTVTPVFRKKALEQRFDAIVAEEVGALAYDERIDLELAMGRIALRLAAWVLLGEELDPTRAEELAAHQREVVNWVGIRLGQLTGFVPVAWRTAGFEMKEHRAALHAYADEVIARAARKPPAEDDYLAALLRSRAGGKPLTEPQLRGHLLGIFLAGNETTAAALSWMLVHAAGSPDHWANVAADPDRNAMPFITEALRIHPAVWGIPRTPNRSGVYLGATGLSTRVRRGQIVNVYLRALNRDARAWPDPLKFDPDRHLTATDDAHRTLFPFGLGPRGCIGQHLALAELRAIVPALARRGRVTIDGVAEEDPKLSLRVRGGLTGRISGDDSAATGGERSAESTQ